ncbi:MAG: DEAD/DEAH box helicase [Microbacteriaceae bacterium]|nr:DEAD/DEAH box helicase [Microbacteriaceae bacterium]
MKFSELNIDADIVDALSSRGIISPFPIQEQTIPYALEGRDLIGQAKTGTGKTFGFGLPILQQLGKNPGPVESLVVVPTRELAIQVYEDLAMAGSNRGTKVVAIYGGKGYESQIAELQAGASIVVGTPGRLLDLMGKKMLSLKNVKILVLDEADRMLDLGFLPDVEKLMAATPATRQTMLFSATMPATIVTLARRYMNAPLHIRANAPEEGITQANIRHLVYRAHPLDKPEVVGRILQARDREKVIIFARTKRLAQTVIDELKDRGFKVAGVHGDMSQETREKGMKAFRSGAKDVLVATDVAARGIDVDDVSHVINYTIPEDEKVYLHRVGRTGRAGRTGIAVTFVDWDDLHKWAHIAKALELDPEHPVETYSSSPHLFADLDIAEGTRGRLKESENKSAEKKAPAGKKPPSRKPGRDNTGRKSERSATEKESVRSSAGKKSEQGAAPKSQNPEKRQRTRTRTVKKASN